MKTKTKNLTLTAILAAVMLLFGFTPIGYIPLGPVQITLMCLPVIIGTLVLGLRTGFFLGIIFALTSVAQLFMNPSPVLAPLFFSPENWYEPLIFMLIVFIPRMAIGPVTYLVSKGLKTGRGKLNLGIACAVGSLTNTIGFLGMMYLFFGQRIGEIISNIGLPYDSAGAFVLVIGATNGLPEAGVAVAICLPVVLALRKVYKQEKTGDKSE